MGVMTAHPPFAAAMVRDAVPLGWAGSLVKDETGGVVYLHGQMVFSWDESDEAGRRWAAVKLASMKAAGVGEIAAAFDVTPSTLWLWNQLLEPGGIGALVPETKGPNQASRLTQPVLHRLVTRRQHPSPSGVGSLCRAGRAGRGPAALRSAARRLLDGCAGVLPARH